MADIAAGDVTYTLNERNKVKLDNGLRMNFVTIAFGDGSDTYPTGGVPLTNSSMGITTELKALIIYDMGYANGFVYKWESDGDNTIRIYQADNDAVADSALIELGGGVATPAAATIKAVAIGY